jgi:hypothetical protein
MRIAPRCITARPSGTAGFAVPSDAGGVVGACMASAPAREEHLAMADLSTAVWRRAADCTHSDCVEVALAGGHVALRDSKRPDGGVLVFTRAEWEAFVAGVRGDEFDPGRQASRADG